MLKVPEILISMIIGVADIVFTVWGIISGEYCEVNPLLETIRVRWGLDAMIFYHNFLIAMVCLILEAGGYLKGNDETMIIRKSAWFGIIMYFAIFFFGGRIFY